MPARAAATKWERAHAGEWLLDSNGNRVGTFKYEDRERVRRVRRAPQPATLWDRGGQTRLYGSTSDAVGSLFD